MHFHRAGQENDDKRTPHEDKLVRMFLFLLSTVCSAAQMEQSRWVLSDLSPPHTQLLQHFTACNTLLLSIVYIVHKRVGLSVWCWVAIITGVSPRVNSLTRYATHLPHFTFVENSFNFKGSLKTHMKKSNDFSQPSSN